MLLEAFNDAKYLETLTGLDKLYNEGDELLESVDWHGDEDEEDDFWGRYSARDRKMHMIWLVWVRVLPSDCFDLV